jgi:hypothetical protein
MLGDLQVEKKIKGENKVERERKRIEGDKWYSCQELEYNMLSGTEGCKTEECVFVTRVKEIGYCRNDEI